MRERGHVRATRDDSVVYCQIVGVGNMHNCAPFQAFSEELQEQGYLEFVLDFSHCDGLDSTFLGVIVGLAVGADATEIHVINATSGVRRTMTEIGIDQLVDLRDDPLDLPDIPLERLDAIEESPSRRVTRVLRAHETLCKVQPANEALFGRFITLLKSELEGDDQ